MKLKPTDFAACVKTDDISTAICDRITEIVEGLDDHFGLKVGYWDFPGISSEETPPLSWVHNSKKRTLALSITFLEEPKWVPKCLTHLPVSYLAMDDSEILLKTRQELISSATNYSEFITHIAKLHAQLTKEINGRIAYIYELAFAAAKTNKGVTGSILHDSLIAADDAAGWISTWCHLRAGDAVMYNTPLEKKLKYLPKSLLTATDEQILEFLAVEISQTRAATERAMRSSALSKLTAAERQVLGLEDNV